MKWSDLVGVRVELPSLLASASATGTQQGKAPRASKENPLFSSTEDNGNGTSATETVSSLLTVQSLVNLTFSTTVITLLWKLIQRLFGAGAGEWVPLLLCLTFVAVSWVASYATKPTTNGTKVVSGFVAIVTGLVLTATVLGINAAILS
jgi:hypothetical protein